MRPEDTHNENLSIRILLWFCASRRCQVSDALSRPPKDGTDAKAELPVPMNASDKTMDDTSTSIFALKAHKTTFTHSATNADITDTTEPTLPEFFISRSADELSQDLTRQLGQAETEFTVYKNGVLEGRAPIAGALQMLLLQSLTQRFLNMSNHHPSFRSPWKTLSVRHQEKRILSE